MGDGIALAESFEKSIRPEEVVLGPNVNIRAYTRIESELIGCNQEVNLSFGV